MSTMEILTLLLVIVFFWITQKAISKDYKKRKEDTSRKVSSCITQIILLLSLRGKSYRKRSYL